MSVLALARKLRRRSLKDGRRSLRMIALLLEKAVGQGFLRSSVNDPAVCVTAHSNLQHRAALASRSEPDDTNGEMPMKMGVSAPVVVIGDY
jgi:hypothetical protein